MELWYDETAIPSPTDLVPGVDFLVPEDAVSKQAESPLRPPVIPPVCEPVTHSAEEIVGPRETPGADATSTPEGTRKRCARRPASRLPRQAVRVLEQWLARHRETPYPSHKRLNELQAESGLERTQVLNWFANARKRGKARLDATAPHPKRATHPHMSTHLSTHLSTSTYKGSTPLSRLHPLEQWFYSGMENEAASLADIQEAVRAGQVDVSPRRGPSRWLSRARQFHDLTKDLDCHYDESLASSMEIRSYAANALSVSSGDWRSAEEDGAATHRKTTRRRHHRNAASLARSSTRGGGPSEAGESVVVAAAVRRFQCTFCEDSFKRKHDWQRHEKSQHLPLERWTCCPDGSVHVDPLTNAVTCVFCGAPDPDAEHVGGHGYTQCVARPVAERTFYRKDHLGQHVRLMHGGGGMTACMDGWRSAVTVLASRCGFCAEEQTTWQARIDHIAEHFRDGETMDQWRGDWGFRPDVMAMLERATLPEERTVPDRRDTRVPDDVSVMPASEYHSFDYYSLQGDETLSYVEQSVLGWDTLDAQSTLWPETVDWFEDSVDGTLSSMLFSEPVTQPSFPMDGWTDGPF